MAKKNPAQSRRSSAGRPKGHRQTSSVDRNDRSDPILRSVQTLASREAELRAANSDLHTENDRLKRLLADIQRAVRVPAAPKRAARQSPRVGQMKPAPSIRRKRRPITDPVTLEKRRAALAKARKALAAKRAAAAK